MNFLQSVTVAALATGLAATSAFALDFGSGVSVTGTFELEYNDIESSGSDTLGYGEVDISFGQPGGGFGGFVGFDAYTLDSDSETAFYGALSYSGGFGTFQIGVPRNAMDDYIGTPEVGGSKLIDLQLSLVTGSVLPVVYLGQDIDTPAGFRYDGAFGAVKVGFSYHSVDDTDLMTAGMNYELGQVVLRTGIEHAEDSSAGATNYFLGAEGTFGAVKAGVLFSDVSILANAESAKFYAVYSPFDGLDLTGTYLTVDQGTNTDLFGVAGRYTFQQGVFVEAGALAGNSNDAYNLSLGVKF